jgi:hypothetical protein
VSGIEMFPLTYFNRNQSACICRTSRAAVALAWAGSNERLGTGQLAGDRLRGRGHLGG